VEDSTRIWKAFQLVNQHGLVTCESNEVKASNSVSSFSTSQKGRTIKKSRGKSRKGESDGRSWHIDKVGSAVSVTVVSVDAGSSLLLLVLCKSWQVPRKHKQGKH
jgi:hypothetical protein